jgi:hypothetical protein
MTVSPITIDNVLRGYFGSVASTITLGTDQLLNPDRLDRPLNKYWMLSVFMYDREAQLARKNEAYEWNEKAAKRLNTLRRLSETNPETAYEYYEENKEALVVGEMLESVFKAAGEGRQYINYLATSPDAAKRHTKEWREEEIKRVKEMEKELYKTLRENRNLIKSAG